MTELVIDANHSEDLFPYNSWEDIYADLGNMVNDLIDECYGHLGELHEGSYCGRSISPESALELSAGYREEIAALQNLDTQDREAVLSVMRMHQKRKNAAEDFINARRGGAAAVSLNL